MATTGPAPKFVDELPAFTRRRRRPTPTQKANAEFVAQLKKRPGVWALWREQSLVGNGHTLRRYGCEVAYRNTDRATSAADIYARWPADKGGSAAP